MWRQVVSQTPHSDSKIDAEHPYAKAAAQLNQLIRSGESLSGNERNCLFLNMEGRNFANASAVTGFDFLDDGRAIAKCDWDADGDLDLWIANRSAPQVRYLENTIGSNHHFVAFRLQGTTSNRDAIGARVELTLAKSKNGLLQGVRAGEGFLAQSSKLVHFGLGRETQITDLTVRWPNGTVERFSPPQQVDAFYEIVEGSSKLRPWYPASTKPTEKPLAVAPSHSMATANLLLAPFPLPPLDYFPVEGSSRDMTRPSDGLTLVNLWAEWCQPCLEELGEWQDQRQQLLDHGIRVLAISIDADGKNQEDHLSSIAKRIKDMRIGFDVGAASQSMPEIVQMVHNTIYDHHQRIPVPTTLLLNEEGNLMALYKGRVTVDRILADVARCRDADPLARLPFRGRWVGKVGPYQLSKLISELWDAGLSEEAMRFVGRIAPHSDKESFKARLSLAHRLKQTGKPAEAMKQLQLAHKIASQDPEVNLQIGILHAEAGRLPVAAGYFLIALENSEEPRAEIHANLGTALRQLNQFPAAEEHLKRATELDGSVATAFHSLGLLQASQVRHEEALANFTKAIELNDQNVSFRINRALALAGLRQYEKAIGELDVVLSQDPQSSAAWIYKGEIYTQANQWDDAIDAFQRVVARQPKATRVWLQLGQLQERHGKPTEALRSYRKLIELSPDDHRPFTRMAWILATSRHDQIRNGPQALHFAKQAVTRTASNDPIALDVLAAAYAENGDFGRAMQICRKAIGFAAAQPGDRLLQDLERHLESYSNQRPIRAKTD